MAIGSENYPNTDTINAAYPWGGIKDNNGSGNGTPINKLTNDDIHQTLRKVLSLAGITPNGLPDNVTNGYQYVQALDKLYKKYSRFFSVTADASFTKDHINNIVFVNGSGSFTFTLPDGATLRDGDSLVIYNGAGSTDFNLVAGAAGVIVNNPGVIKKQYDYIHIAYDKPNQNWHPIDFRKTAPKPVISKQAGSSSFGPTTSFTVPFGTEVSDVDGQFNSSTGVFTPDKIGFFQMNVNVAASIAAAYSGNIQFQFRKNGSIYENLSYTIDDYTGSGESINFQLSGVFEAGSTSDTFEVRIVLGSSATIVLGGYISYHYIPQ